MKILLVATACAAVFLSAPTQAGIIGGDITGGSVDATSSFINLSVPFNQSNPDNTVGNNTFQNPNFYAFDEETFTTVADLALERFRDEMNHEPALSYCLVAFPSRELVPTSLGNALDFGGLTAGQKIESHYVFFDPRNSQSLEGM